MKAKFTGLTVAALVVFAGLFLNGCCKSPCRASDDEATGKLCLPKQYVVVKGLCESDYDSEGWPRYIMNCNDGSIMAGVPETCFVMGTNRGEVDEAPRHRVTVGRYYIDLYEVNNVQFSKFAEKMKCPCTLKDDPCLSKQLVSTQTEPCWLKRNCELANENCLKADACRLPKCVQLDVDYFKEYWTPCVNNNHPARAVSYWEAWYYCRWVGKDLPTEAEWELAAKGPRDDRMYPWGNIEPDSQHLLCNYDGARATEDGYAYTAPVAAFAAGRSPFGCYNMAGNVWEWTKDYYDSTQYSVTNFAEGTRNYAPEATREFTDPAGAAYGDLRSIRGGSYTSEIANCRVTTRESAPANFHGMNIGFRGVLRIR